MDRRQAATATSRASVLRSLVGVVGIQDVIDLAKAFDFLDEHRAATKEGQGP